MYAVDDQMETIHLYVVREPPKQPYTALPLLAALLCLAAMAALTLYSGAYPSYVHRRLTLPAIPLAMRAFTAEVPVIPTGIKTYPATYATGVLTFSNGSVIGQSVPAGFSVGGVATDSAVYVPGATADGFGIAAVAAHGLVPAVNLPELAINTVIGDALFIRNLRAFTGAHPAYSVTYITAKDRLVAAVSARNRLAALVRGYHYPCQESRLLRATAAITWHCQFVYFKLPPSMRVAAARLSGKNFLVDVLYIPRPAVLPLR